MIPSRQSQIPMMFGHGRTGARFGSSAALTFGQLPNMDGQLPPLPLLDVAQNPAEINIGRIRDDEFIDVKSSCDNHEEGGGSNDCHKKRDRPRGRKCYHRHTQHQIQELQAFFNKCPHPDDKKRKQLSLELGLEPLQIKFWFQNRRTQMKTKHGRQETTQLRAENERLWAENKKCKDALSNTPCLSCRGLTALGEMSFEEYHLRMENEKLREKNNRIAALAAKQVARPMLKHSVVSPPITSRLLERQFFVGQLGAVGEPYGIAELVMSYSGLSDQVHKQLIVELAVAAMDELTRMAHIDEPLCPDRDMSTPCILNHEEYMRTFLKVNGPRPPAFKSEASLETAIVMMNHTDLVEILMNVNRWARVFSSIVARAITLEVFSGSGGSYNGALQVMAAEFQVLSPIVPTRETHFVRYCKHHADGTWAVVDVSLEGLRPSSVVRFRRRPSGCLIQNLSHGYSKVTWVEHVEVDDRGVHHIYRPLVNSGLAFGAKRWLSILDRQCDRLATAMATKIPPGEFTNTGMRSMLKLAERMVISFFGGVSASTAHMWTTLCGSGADDIRIMTHRSTDDPGRPHGITISAATSFWLPVPPKRVFDYLCDVLNRNEWDILSSGGVIEKVVHIAHGRETGNAVSLLRVTTAGVNLNNMLILQESCADPTGSFIIYAPVDSVSMHTVFGGGDSDYVALLPSGFAILPDGPTGHGGGNDEPGSGGSLLTAAFQILVNSAPDAMPTLGSVVSVRDLIDCTVRRIKTAMGTEVP